MRPGLVQRISFVAGCLLLWGVAARVRAEATRRVAPPAALHWVRLAGAEGCVSGERLARAVEARLGRELFADAEPAARLIEGYVELDRGGYRATLRMSASDGSLLGARELESRSADCQELSETVTLVLAIMIDPEAAATGPPAVAASPAAAVSSPETRAGRAWPRQQLIAFLRGALGLMPGFAVGMGAAYELKLRAWGGLRIEGVGFYERRQNYEPSPEFDSAPPNTPSNGAYFRLAYGSLAYCPLWLGERRVRLSACVSAELGIVHSSGFGLRPEHTSRSLWTSGSATVRVAWRFAGALVAHLGASLVVPFVRHKYEVRVDAAGEEEYDELYRSAPYGGTLDVGLGVSFGR